jgi:hypothetical protein
MRLLSFLVLVFSLVFRTSYSENDVDPLAGIHMIEIRAFNVPNTAMVITQWNGMGDSFTAGVGSGDYNRSSYECE